MKLSKRLLIRYIRTKFKVLTLVSKKKAAEEAFLLFCTPLTRAKRKYPSALKHTEHLEISLNGLKLYGSRWNHPAAKKALILHGFSSASHNFERYVNPLVAKGYEVVAFDAPAHGRSEGKTVNAVQYAQMVREVSNEFGPFDSYITHSFGGLAASLALETLPHNENHKLVLLAPATETTSAIEGALILLRLSDETVKKELHQVIYNSGGQWPEWYSVIRALKQINAQVLWIHDTADDITPYHDAKNILAENLPNIKFVTTTGLGHSKIYRNADVIKSVIDFL